MVSEILSLEQSQDTNNRHNTSYRREIKSYVCRNRKLSDVNKWLIDHYYPVWGLANNKNWDFTEIFKNNNKVILEIGFGQGNTLAHNARCNPDTNYIGIEVYQAGCINVLNYIKQYELSNLRVCQGDAQLILSHHLSPKSLSGVQIFFPDPWPKKKHHKRRLIQPDFINLLAEKLIKGGFIHLATDWAPYAEHMTSVLENNDRFKCSHVTDLANKRLFTRFEEKGLKQGHVIKDLIYQLED